MGITVVKAAIGGEVEVEVTFGGNEPPKVSGKASVTAKNSKGDFGEIHAKRHEDGRWSIGGKGGYESSAKKEGDQKDNSKSDS